MKKDKVGLQDELRDLSPTLLRNKAAHDGMQTPAGYFDHLESSIFQRIDEEGYRKPTPPPISGGFSIWRNYRYAALAAAAVVILLSAWWFMKPETANLSSEDYQQLAASLSAEDAEGYVMENLQEFETGTLMQYAAVEPSSAPSDLQPQKSTPGKQRNQHKAVQSILDDMSPEEFNMMLDELSDEELDAIL